MFIRKIRNKCNKVFQLTLCVSIFVPSLFAQTGIDALNNITKSLSSKEFQVDFSQVTFVAVTERKVMSKGVMSFTPPGYTRWKYNEPDSQTIIINREHVIILDSDLQTYSVKSRAELEQANSLEFLSGNNLVRNFTTYKGITDVLPDCGSDESLNIRPISSRTVFKYLSFCYNSENYSLSKMLIMENTGNYRIFNLTNYRDIPESSENVFSFNPPPKWKKIDE